MKTTDHLHNPSDHHEMIWTCGKQEFPSHNPPPTGGGLEAGAQESPCTSDVKLEDNVVPPDKGKGKAVLDDTAQGGSGHDPPRDQERVYHLKR